MERNGEARLAVLIDADNTAARWAEPIFEEIASHGEASVRRIYGDFSSGRLKSWEKKLAGLAVTPHQQFAYTRGKNSTDIALVIDAMDLMHSGRFDGFVLVSSDSDFARLASRLREQGLAVFGIGGMKTPEVFRKACKRFIFVENLIAEEPAPRTPGKTQSPRRSASSADEAEPERQPPSKAVPLILAAMRGSDDDWVTLSAIGRRVRAAHPEFDPRSYGMGKLVDLVERCGGFEVERNESPMRARIKRPA